MAGTARAADYLALADGLGRHRHGEKRALEGNFRGPISKTHPHFCERSCCWLGCQRGDRAHRATHKSARSAGSQMSKDEADTMSDKPAAVEHGGEGDAGRETMQALDRLESEIAQAPADRGLWGAPEYVTVGSISVHPDRLPVDEDVVEGIVATIKAGNVNALPPIHVWRKQTGNVPILAAGRNRLEAHMRAGCEPVLARAIYGDTPEIARAVEAIEIEENLHRRELSPALRKTYTARLKALHEQEHPKSKGGRPSKTVPKAGKVSKPERFTKAVGRRRLVQLLDAIISQ